MDSSKKTDITDSNTVTTPSCSCSDTDDHSYPQQRSSGKSPHPSHQSSTNQSQDAALGTSEICNPVSVAEFFSRSPQLTECRSIPRATPAEVCGDITGRSCQSLNAYSAINRTPTQPVDTANTPATSSGQGSMPPSYVHHPLSHAAPKDPLQNQTGSSKGNKATGVDITLAAALRSSLTCRDFGHSAPLSTPTTTASSMSKDRSGSTHERDWRASIYQELRGHVVRGMNELSWTPLCFFSTDFIPLEKLCQPRMPCMRVNKKSTFKCSSLRQTDSDASKLSLANAVNGDATTPSAAVVRSPIPQNVGHRAPLSMPTTTPTEVRSPLLHQ
uniref:Uncharacterized protein n=1 Tax=Mesocestoides corti TaxID=53468 RepID=A0A5K3FVE8_MESCO